MAVWVIVRLALGILSLRGARWAYVAFLVLGLLYFPAKAGFRVDSHPCELVFGLPLAAHSLTNYPHIGLFALGFVLASAQFRMTHGSDFVGAASINLAMGALVEVAQGLTGQGHCRVRDLIPDAVGTGLGCIAVLGLLRMGWRPRPTGSLRWWRE